MQRKTTIANLFQAFEEDDKEKLKELVAGIQKFDRFVSFKVYSHSRLYNRPIKVAH